MKVLVIGEIYSSNLGDQAIHLGIREYLLSQNITVNSLDLSCNNTLVANTKPNIHKHNNKIIESMKNISFLYVMANSIRRVVKHVANLKYWLKTFNENDVIIVGGGSLLINNSFSFPISLFFVRLCANYTHKKYYVLGCSFSEKQNYVSKHLLKYFLTDANKIYLRDPLSVQYLEDIFRIKGVSSSDLALLLNRKRKVSNNTIGINIIGFVHHHVLENSVFQKDYYTFLIKSIDILRKKGYEVQLFTTGSEIDYLNAQFVVKNMGQNMKIFHPSSIEELINYLSTCSGIISTRLHAAILSFVVNVPCVSISWDKKIDGFLKSVDAEDNCFLVNTLAEDMINQLFLCMDRDNSFIKNRKNSIQCLLSGHINDILGENK